MSGSPVRAWVLASRPKTLPVAIAPVLVGSAMAWDDGIFNIGIALITVVCALLITIGTNLCNDYADFMSGVDTTNRKGPTRVTQAGLIAAQNVLVGTVLVYSIATALGMILVYRGGWGVSIIGFASILAGILYTAGPWPYGYKGLGDLFVLIFFGPVAVGGTYYVQTLEITSSVIVIGLAPGLLSVAILTVNNIRDIAEDRKANRKTLVVQFGRKFGIGLWLGCVVIAALLPLEFVRVTGDHVWAGLTVLILIPAISILHKLITIHDSADLNPLLGQTAFLLLGYSVIFALFW